MSLKFGQISPLVSMATDRVMMGKWCCHFFSADFYPAIRFIQGQLLEGVECHIYLYCFTFDDINLNRALVIIVLFPTKYRNKKVCANDIGK